MAKYDPLRDYLRKHKEETVVLSFAEIERRLGYMLPKRASQPQWWAADPAAVAQPVQQRAWSDAGFAASLIPGCERVRFSRLGPEEQPPSDATGPSGERHGEPQAPG